MANATRTALLLSSASSLLLAAAAAQAATFTETWTGANGDPWPAQFTFEGDLTGIANKDIQSNEGRVKGVNEITNADAWVYINTTNAEDVDAVVTFRVTNNAIGFGFLARRSDTDSDSFYVGAGKGKRKQ